MLQPSPSRVARIPSLIPSWSRKAGCGQCRAAAVDWTMLILFSNINMELVNSIANANSGEYHKSIYLETELEFFDGNTRAR